MRPAVCISQLMDVVANAKENYVLLVVERSLIPGEGASRRGVGRPGGWGQIVVRPAVRISQLMDVVVNAKGNYVLLVVERSLIPNEGASRCGVGRPGLLGQIVV